jgi:hypothetical protein
MDISTTKMHPHKSIHYLDKAGKSHVHICVLCIYKILTKKSIYLCAKRETCESGLTFTIVLENFATVARHNRGVYQLL